MRNVILVVVDSRGNARLGESIGFPSISADERVVERFESEDYISIRIKAEALRDELNAVRLVHNS